ncbi:hypothetical protein N0V90_006186 [Kalmusia sp. IMI 367209]|nr:hypothetical protein N0V90_006186 [Kalmusia sp. IMI 367209]
MPKRSTGCFECRKRKVRCDEARPECNTCVRRGTKCPGYRPLQSFILHKFEEKGDRPSIIKEDDNRYKYANHKTSEEPTSANSEETIEFPQLPGRRPSEAPIVKQVSPVAIERVQHVGELIWLYLPRSDPHTLPPPSALMLALPQLPATSGVLLAAVDALSAAQLAVANRNYPLVNRSRSLYGTALSQMMKTIQYPSRVLEDETLLATIYQLTIGYHVRKASMLDADEWMAVTAKAAKVDPYVALIDICIHIPRLLERTDRLVATDQDAIDKLIDESQHLATRAKEWFANFEKHGPRYTRVDVSEFQGFSDICDDRTFDEGFNFYAFGAGICYMIYWMSMLILQSNTFKMLRLYRQLEPRELFMWDRELGAYADCSCRSVPYNCRTEVGYVGRFGSLTPLVVARKYFEAKKAEKEIAWCETVYQNARIPGLYSTIVMEPLKSMQRMVQQSDRYI